VLCNNDTIAYIKDGAGRIFDIFYTDNFYTDNAKLSSNSLILLASPTGFEPVLPP
jgi:hypothetical protein